ncbi:MAG TPA: 4Fe-4S dicluster domain-containing protein [Candidatus Dormibacteraeota bacterium]|nr:4Fe-4S dicluster domain-containing protein [Candidatus Dormibacteraeota bacterium]
MTYRITQLCIECGRCVPVCPQHAIDVVEGHHRIEPDLCDDTAMCVRYCPVEGAIVSRPAEPAVASPKQ